MMVCGRQGWANAAVASAISRGADYWEGCIGSEADFQRNVRMWRKAEFVIDKQLFGATR